MSALKGFNSLPRLVQIILLLIPGINWLTEIIVRVSAALHGKAGKQILVLIFAFFLPALFSVGLTCSRA